MAKQPYLLSVKIAAEDAVQAMTETVTSANRAIENKQEDGTVIGEQIDEVIDNVLAIHELAIKGIVVTYDHKREGLMRWRASIVSCNGWTAVSEGLDLRCAVIDAIKEIRNLCPPECLERMNYLLS